MIAQIQMRRGTTAEWAAAAPVILAAGEPGYDSTLKGMKIGDGATEWAGLPWTDNGTNPNILHNWDFRNPVNQRGLTSYTAVGYTIDRWKQENDGCQVNVVTGGVTFVGGTSTRVVSQCIENGFEKLTGKVVTLSVMIDGVVTSLTQTLNLVSGQSFDGNGVSWTGGQMDIYKTNANKLDVRIIQNAGATVTIQAVKLELGTVSTLHLDPPMDYGVELMKCQRYFLNLGTYAFWHGYAFSSTVGVGYISVPAKMRINPTLSGIVFNIAFNGTQYTTTVTGITAAANRLDLVYSGSGMPINIAGTGTGGADALMAFADL